MFNTEHHPKKKHQMTTKINHPPSYPKVCGLRVIPCICRRDFDIYFIRKHISEIVVGQCYNKVQIPKDNYKGKYIEIEDFFLIISYLFTQSRKPAERKEKRMTKYTSQSGNMDFFF